MLHQGKKVQRSRICRIFNLRTLIIALLGLQLCLIMVNLRLTERFGTVEMESQKIKETRYKNITQRKECKPANHRLFPFCEEKFQFVEFVYSKNKCLKDVHGIDGSSCSVLRYLTEIEPYCQPIDGTAQLMRSRPSDHQQAKCKIKTDLDGALSLLALKDYRWLKQRLRHLWPDWLEAANELKANKHFKEGNRKKILIYLGSMYYQPFILQQAGKGGFVGELVQWTDLIASAYILGHDVKVVLDGKSLKEILQPDEQQCASKSIPSTRIFDIIFTDFNGIIDLRKIGTSNYARLRCKLRILDSFGTEAEFNYRGYGDPIPGGKSVWGGNDLILQQILTYFPHSPDNSFLGFIGGSGKDEQTHTKKDLAVIYGKNDYYLRFYQGLLEYLDTIKDFFEIHATMHITKGQNLIPSYVVNHGVMKADDLKNLLSQSKVFIGLGFPFEGPGPLEAIARGAIFLNPKFDPPRNKLTDAFFKGKPNLRKLTSQNPYLEDYVGEPYVYTLDIKDLTNLKKILKEIKARKSFPGYLPKEFTNIGMLERVHAFIQHQNFCDDKAPRWPPLSSLELFLAAEGVSCKHECHKRGKICEPSYFTDINVMKSFERLGIFCNGIKNERKLYHPSYHPSNGKCYIQDHYLYFSCVAEQTNVRRICPCRNFQKGQTALCKSCL